MKEQYFSFIGSALVSEVQFVPQNAIIVTEKNLCNDHDIVVTEYNGIQYVSEFYVSEFIDFDTHETEYVEKSAHYVVHEWVHGAAVPINSGFGCEF